MEMALEDGWENGMAGVYGGLQRVSRFLREAYVNPFISPSLPSCCSPVVPPIASREFLEYS
jgi:hypothetical protein